MECSPVFFVVITCAALNLAGIRVVGITSLWLFFLLSAPFALIVVLAPMKAGALAGAHGTGTGASSAYSAAFWWRCGTIWAGITLPPSHRRWKDRSATYPKAMIAACRLVSLTYVLPFLAVYFTGIPATAFAEDGSWAQIAGLIGGKILGFEWLRFLVVLGGMMSALACSTRW